MTGDDRRLLQRTRTLLNRAVRDEANHLLTEPPKFVDGGWDFGLFCREHAYVTYFLALLNKLPAEIRRGHYFALSPSGDGNKTLDSGDDHAWCAVGSIVPLDLSMTFRCADGFPLDDRPMKFPQLDRPIIGAGVYGPYRVTHTENEAAYRIYMATLPDPACIAYLGVERVEVPAVDLLERPEDFLQFGPGSITEAFGRDIFAKIAVHLDAVAHGGAPLRFTTGQPQALGVIACGYHDAVPRLRSAIGSPTTN